MPTPRFFIPASLTANASINLPDKLTHYILRVLRLEHNAEIVLFDGTGGQYPATLQINNKVAQALTGAHQPLENELQGKISLYQGIASGNKMDWIVEKAVELGVTEFHPLAAHRSLIKLSGERLEKRLQHWQAIIESASEQCGRNRLMQLHSPKSFAQSMATYQGTAVFCHPEATAGMLQSINQSATELSIFIGPEGGWSDQELELGLQNQLLPVRLGGRILRTETAGIVMTTTVCTLLNWY